MPLLQRFFHPTLLVALLSTAALVQAGSWQTNTSLGGFNKVHVYTPATLSPVGNGRALLLVLHGCTQNTDAYLTAGLESAADTFGMTIAVPDAMNKAGFSCWSYWQGSISRNAGDYQNLINLAQTLAGDPARQIDPDQIYIAGLSSGATFAAQTACLAPDIFAGVASSAGPSIGTSSSGAISVCESVSPAQFESRCRSYAGAAYQSHFDTQVAVVAHGSGDTTVNTCYNEQNANGYARLFDVTAQAGSTTISEGPRTAEQFLWTDHRVAMLWLNNLGHTWSGGAGASGSYIGSQSINFASYLGEHFAATNRRIDRNQPPVIDQLAVISGPASLTATGIASDPDGSVDEIVITISRIDSGTPQLVQTLQTGVDAGGQFDASASGLDDGLYEISATAIDDQGLAGAALSVIERVGDEPDPAAPVLGDIAVAIDGQCATVSGTVVDPNQNLASVSVDFEQGDHLIASVAASLDGALYAAARCDLPGGTIVATTSATDTTDLSTSDSIEFQIDAGQTGDYNFHIGQGHITWGNGYAGCYLAFGMAEFTMREFSSSGDQCVWIADGAAACQGPSQACSAPGGGGTEPDPDPDPEPDPDPGCSQVTTMNYLHRTAGRATSSGLFWAPDYFASGSGEPMPGSTYGTTTLSSSDGQTWFVADC